jgi:hypothetical protein
MGESSCIRHEVTAGEKLRRNLDSLFETLVAMDVGFYLIPYSRSGFSRQSFTKALTDSL